VPERWVLNASPVISLARIGQTDLFQALAEQVVLPRAVAIEIEAGLVEDPARTAIVEGKFEVVETPPPPADILAWDLGEGETAVLTYAIANPGWTVIVDDVAARKCARSFSLPMKKVHWL
jgi:predicted nucleic acid-binding protein